MKVSVTLPPPVVLDVPDILVRLTFCARCGQEVDRRERHYARNRGWHYRCWTRHCVAEQQLDGEEVNYEL